MCLHYLVKLIARVLSPYITYFSIHVVDFWHKIFTNCWNNSFQHSTTVTIVFTDIHYIFFASDAYNICSNCFQCSLTLSVTCSRSEALYRIFVQNLLQTVTPNKIASANQHFLYVLVNIFTFNELWNHWNVTFCHKTRRL